MFIIQDGFCRTEFALCWTKAIRYEGWRKVSDGSSVLGGGERRNEQEYRLWLVGSLRSRAETAWKIATTISMELVPLTYATNETGLGGEILPH
jgi:hypothetical protein